MASLIKKKIGGKAYYYARECKRVDGRPKIVWQKYLGKAEDIVRCMTDAGAPEPAQPQEALIAEFGAVAALYDLAERLQIAATIDRHVPKSGPGPGVGTYLLVAILNRCVAPCSKSSMADWFEKTALRRWVNVEARQLSSQRFWDNMDRVSGEAVVKIEQEITARLVREFEIDLRQVLFDATNFFTFIDTFNERATLPQRGKSKEGRQSLRIVGVARFLAGLGAVTNLTDRTPWGLWVGFDVMAGVALAAGGFVVAALVYCFRLEGLRPLVRPAVLTAFLGYVAVAIGLLFDLGRPWNIWRPMFFWQHHSVLFEVAWCVMLYTTVLALEFLPVRRQVLRIAAERITLLFDPGLHFF